MSISRKGTLQVDPVSSVNELIEMANRARFFVAQSAQEMMSDRDFTIPSTKQELPLIFCGSPTFTSGHVGYTVGNTKRDVMRGDHRLSPSYLAFYLCRGLGVVLEEYRILVLMEQLRNGRRLDCMFTITQTNAPDRARPSRTLEGLYLPDSMQLPDGFTIVYVS